MSDMRNVETTDVNIHKLFQRFRNDMMMNKTEWYKFCKRYTEREPTTIVWYIKNMYDIDLRANQIQEYLANELMWCN